MKLKEIIYTSTFCIALSCGLSSCSNEEDLKFDKSAAERLDDAKVEYSELLTSNGGKWVMEYFCNSEEEGYNYVVTFNKNGSVTMSGENKYIAYEYSNSSDSSTPGGTVSPAPIFKSETSMWDVILDSGPVLSFSTYNRTFHIFSSPDDIPGTVDPDSGNEKTETGYGHEGDYEFIFLSQPDENTIKLKGKKSGIYIYMRRLDANVNDEAYLDGIEALKKNSFSAKLDTLVITAADGNRFILSGASTRLFSIYPEGGDRITQSVTANAIVTADGLRLMQPTYVKYANDRDSIAFDSFKFDADGNLLSLDDNKTKISGQDLSTLMMSKKSWIIDNNSYSGDIATSYNNMVSDLSKYNKTTIRSIKLTYDEKEQKNVLELTCKSKVKVGGQYQWIDVLLYYYVSAKPDGKYKIHFESIGNNQSANDYNKACPALASYVNNILNNSFVLSSATEFVPLNILLSNQNNSDKFQVSLQ